MWLRYDYSSYLKTKITKKQLIHNILNIKKTKIEFDDTAVVYLKYIITSLNIKNKTIELSNPIEILSEIHDKIYMYYAPNHVFSHIMKLSDLPKHQLICIYELIKNDEFDCHI